MAGQYGKYPAGGGGGSGDVVGPGSSTDNAVARFDGTTGKLLQNSPVIVADNGDTSGIGVLSANSAKLLFLTANRAVATDGTDQLASSTTSAVELGYVTGVTSSIQTQLNAKEPTVTKGDLTDAGTDGIVVTNGTGAVIGSGTSLAQHVADSTHNGYLSSTDWATFNSKQAGPLTGDVTTSGAAATLATVNGNVGSFGSATQVMTQTVNAKGLTTAAANVSIQIAESQVTNLTTDLAAKITNPMTTGGDVIYGGTSGLPTRLPNGSAGQALLSAGGTAAPVWTFPQNVAVTATKTGTYAIAATDYLVVCDSSGGTFTVTLPTAIGATGKQYTIKKIDSSVIAVAIATTSSQTIDGVTTNSVNTPFEQLTVVSNGANWLIIDRTYPQTPVAYTPTFVGLGTVTAITAFSWREGPFLNIQCTFTCGTTTAVTASMTMGFNGTSGNVTASSTYSANKCIVGKGVVNDGGVTNFGGRNLLVAASATTLNFGVENATGQGFAVQTGTAYSSNNVQNSFFGQILIAGWN